MTEHSSIAPVEEGRMKKRMLAIAALIVLLVATVGATLAFTTQTKQADNIMTFGNVKMDVHMIDGDDADVAGEEFEATGAPITRKVTFENTGSTEMYVRARPVVTITRADGSTTTADTNTVTYMMNTTNWSEKDGWYYYESAVGVDESTTTLMEGLQFQGDYMDAAGPGGQFDFTVEAQAVQVAHNDDSAMDAKGWPEADQTVMAKNEEGSEN